MNILTALINQSYSAVQWYSRTGHDQLMDILSVLASVLLHLCSDAGVVAQVFRDWLMDTFNSCDTDFLPVPPLSTEEGYITYAVIASDLLLEWQRMTQPVEDWVRRLSAAIGIAVAVVRELV